MSLRPLAIDPHAALHRAAKPVDRFDAALRNVVRDMLSTMYAHDGVGLAAPQIGVPLQLFVLNPSLKIGRELAVVNPLIEDARGEAAIVEGCLSLPEHWQKVARRATLRLRGLDPYGEPIDLQADGLLAIVIQHEVDHLRGRLISDYAPVDAPTRRSVAGSARRS